MSLIEGLMMQIAAGQVAPELSRVHRTHRSHRRGLRNKIIFWAFVPAAILLAAVGLISLYTYQVVTQDLVIERDRALTRLTAQQLSANLAAYTDPQSDMFLSVFEAGKVIFNRSGSVLSAEPESIEGWGTEWYERFPFRQMAISSEPVFSDVVIDPREGERVILAFAPITGLDGDSIGGIGALLRLGAADTSVFYDAMEQLRRGTNSSIYIVDSKGQVIHHTNKEYSGADFSGVAAVSRALEGQSGSLSARDITGRRIVTSFTPVPGTRWGLVTEVDWHELTAPSRLYGQFMWILLALGLAVPTCIVSLGIRKIMHPVQQLTCAAQAMAGGNFDQRISTATGDELEELAQQFNIMATRLQSAYDHLEQEVTDRTKELAALNRLAGVVSRSLDLEETLNDALDEALNMMSLSKGMAFLAPEHTDRLTVVAHRNLGEAVIAATSVSPPGGRVAGLAAYEGKTVFRKVAQYPSGNLKRLLLDEGIRLVVSTPLLAKGKTVGAIDLCFQDDRAVTDEQTSLLAAIGHQIGVAVENARLYEQAQQLAVVEERGRLARELHDAVTQTLFSASLIAQTLPSVWEKDKGQGEALLEQLRRLSRAALAEMRALLLELRPAALVEASLGQLLQQLAETAMGRTGIPVEVTVLGDCTLPEDVHVALYRMAQEALNNIVKHAQASHVGVLLRCSPTGPDERRRAKQCLGAGKWAELVVSDNGRGFSNQQSSPGELGLSIMRERSTAIGASLDIHSVPGEGTRITIAWSDSAQ